MKNDKYIQANSETYQLDSSEYQGFREGLMKSALYSLFTQGKLTRLQYECCVEKVVNNRIYAPKS